MERAERVFGLDVMRATAIALVILSHATLFFPANPTLFGAGLLAGYFGVELFFVLSGFLIGGILIRALQQPSPIGQTLRQFWLRRWFRTLPNYFLFLALNIALATYLGRSLPSLWQYAFFLQNIIARPPSFFVESWSLAIEEWFYLLLPIALLGIARRSPLRTRIPFILFVGVLIVTIARSIYVACSDAPWLTNVRMIVVFRLDACMFGVAAAWWKIFHREQWQKLSRLLLILGLVILAAMAAAPFTLNGDSLFMRTGGFTLTSLGAVFLLPALDAWRSGTGAVARALTKISLWSYSLYLVNYPVYVLLHRSGINSPVLLVAAFVFISVIIAAFVYRMYELPMMSLRDRSGDRVALPRGVEATS